MNVSIILAHPDSGSFNHAIASAAADTTICSGASYALNGSASGGSGCDFSEALRYTELIEAERARLDRVDALVVRLEELLLHCQAEPSL